MKAILSLLLTIFCLNIASAQTETYQLGKEDMFTDKNGSGTVNITANSQLKEVLNTKIKLSEEVNMIPGYRVQVFFASGAPAKAKAQQLKESLKHQFPDVEFYIGYQAPYFTVKAGDFRTRLEALIFKSKLTDESQALWIVKEMVKLPKL